MSVSGSVAVPQHLVPRWSELPVLAAVSSRAFAPDRLRGRWRAVFTPMWLAELALQRAVGRVLRVGPATLTVQQPASVRRRLLAVGLVVPLAGLVLVGVLVSAAALVGTAGAWVGGATGYLVGQSVGMAAVTGVLVWQLAQLVRPAARSAGLRRTLAPLRASGRPWAEVCSLAGGRDGQATRDLVAETVAWAETTGLGLAAIAADDRLTRVYLRLGFRPARPGSAVLLRHPQDAVE